MNKKELIMLKNLVQIFKNLYQSFSEYIFNFNSLAFSIFFVGLVSPTTNIFNF